MKAHRIRLDAWDVVDYIPCSLVSPVLFFSVLQTGKPERLRGTSRDFGLSPNVLRNACNVRISTCVVSTRDEWPVLRHSVTGFRSSWKVVSAPVPRSTLSFVRVSLCVYCIIVALLVAVLSAGRLYHYRLHLRLNL